jgi:prepilin-type N-terminal cleavage/methylation domain-containing protein
MAESLKTRAGGVGRGQGGFTLLELLIAMSVLMVGVLTGILPLQFAAVNMRSYSFQQFNASLIARQFVDNFNLLYANTAWSTVTAGITTGGFSTNKAACPSDYDTQTCPARQTTDWIGNAANKVFCRNGVKYYLNWKTAGASTLGAVSGLHAAKVTAQVAWRPAAVQGSYGSTGACRYYEVNAYKYCTLGDTPWGCP